MKVLGSSKFNYKITLTKIASLESNPITDINILCSRTTFLESSVCRIKEILHPVIEIIFYNLNRFCIKLIPQLGKQVI